MRGVDTVHRSGHGGHVAHLGGINTSVEREVGTGREEYAHQEDNPDAQLGEPYQPDADDFANHQFKRFDRRYHHLDDTVGLLLHDARHHLSAVEHEEHVDDKSHGHADNRHELGRGLGLGPILFEPDGVDLEIDVRLVDDALDVGDIVREQFLVLEVIFHLRDDVQLATGGNLFLRIDGHALRIVEQVVLDDDIGIGHGAFVAVDPHLVGR